MKASPTIFGRTREISQLTRAIGDGTDGLRLVFLAGPSGIGKTTVIDESATGAIDNGFNAVFVHGRSGVHSAPFAPWKTAVDNGAVLQFEAEAGDAAHDVHSVGVHITQSLVTAAADNPVVVIIDDVQSLDESSIAVLPYVLGINEDSNVSVVFVEQTDAPDVHYSYRAFRDAMLGEYVVQRFELDPLDDDSVRQIIEEIVPEELRDAISESAIERSQGNPWFAHELAVTVAHGNGEIPANISAAATTRIEALSTDAADIVQAIALCDESTPLAWFAPLVPETKRWEEVHAEIVNSGLVRIDGETVDIAHPLMRHALTDEMSTAMRRALHREIAHSISVVCDDQVVANRAQGFHFLRAGQFEAAVTCFLAAADANELLGNVHEAAADLVHAVEAEQRDAERAQVLRRCAYAAMQISDLRASGYWADLAMLAVGIADPNLEALALIHQYWTNVEGSARDRLERAAALGADTHGWSARAAATLAIFDGKYDQAISLDSFALTYARDNGDKLLECLALAKLGLGHYYTGDLDRSAELYRESIDIGREHGFHDTVFNEWVSLCDILDERLDSQGALNEMREALSVIEQTGLVKYRPFIKCFCAWSLSHLGRLGEALEMCESAVAEATEYPRYQFMTIVAATYFAVANQVGDPEVLRAARSLALASVEGEAFASYSYEVVVEEVNYLASHDRISEALALWSANDPDEDLAQARIATMLVRLRSLSEHSESLPKTVEKARFSITASSPLIDLYVAEIDASMSAEGGDVETFFELVERWDAAGRIIDAARCRMAIAAEYGRTGSIDQQIEQLQRARKVFTSAGALKDSDVAAAQLRQCGHNSRSSDTLMAVGELTRRERQIASLVSEGKKNAEIAAQLHLAEKTVASHLSNIYAKLEISSRTTLAQWVHDSGDSVS